MTGRFLFFGLISTVAVGALFLLILLWRSAASEYTAEEISSRTLRQDKVEYARDSFGDWVDFNGDCLDTRAEFLKERSLISVVLDESGCRVLSGLWIDAYTGDKLESASDIDIDHIFPLKMVWDFGASEWPPAKRRAFNNDFENLAITASSVNRSKGDSSPLNWTPPNPIFRCQYVNGFLNIISKYQIILPISDINAMALVSKDFCG